MSRWIDIDDISLLKTVSVGGLSAKALWKRIRQQPSIDLVRCEECKWADNCSQNVAIRESYQMYEKLNFCSYGCRKESEKMEDNKFLTVAKEYLMELEQKAKDSEYYKGRVDGMEYVVDALQEAFKGKENE